MDFNINVYSQLLLTLKKKHYLFNNSVKFREDNHKKSIFLRHDIDKNPHNALKIARFEYELGIKGIYYFRIIPSVFKPEIIREIAKLGHEIGYHYEDLGTNKGQFKKAIQDFIINLDRFRSITNINSVSMHGHPLSKYNNLDLWKYYNYKNYGIDFEPYLDVDFNKVLYLTDTGRGWNLLKYSVRDKVGNPFNYHNKTTYELIEDLEKGLLPDKIMITIHPQRWHNNIFLWLRELIMQRFKNIIKFFLIKIRY